MLHLCKSNRGIQEPLGELELTDSNSLNGLLNRSRVAFELWSNIPLERRILHITQFLQDYQEQKEIIATTISKEIGKPITQALADIEYDIGYIQRHLSNARKILSPEIIHEDETSTHTMYFEPKGVAAVISPRNYPSSQWVREVIPPLLAGNTILYKPASACMRTGYILSNLIIKHLPLDVHIPVYGDSKLGEALIELETDMTIFTGSASVGKQISKVNGLQSEISHLELGGSAPGIILPDTEINDAMMQTIDYFRVRHGGQICDGLKRLFVHESQYDQLISYMKGYFQELIIGNPLDPATRLGCLVSEQAKEKIQQQIQDSIPYGFQTLELGQYDGIPGAFLPFTLLGLDVIASEAKQSNILQSPCMNEEVFGPVLPIIPYTTIDQAIEYANNTVYGLGGYLRGKNPEQIDYVCSKLKTGNINVNNTNYVIPQVPFGGYTPMSGNFREHGIIGLRNYAEMKVVSKPKI